MDLLTALRTGRRLGITPSTLHVLLEVLADAPLTASEVASRAGMSAAAVVGAVDALERVDMLQRHRCRDRRKKLLHPTEKAFDIFTPTL